MNNSFSTYITVVFKNWKGERVEVSCSSEKEAKQEQDKLRQVGVYSWIEISYYSPFAIASQISEQIGDLNEY